jgi:hypothetical protein
VADASGRIPLFFVNDGSYALRLTDQFGVQSNGGFFYPQIPSIGASSSGGGGTPVDPTTVASTADVKWRLENATIAGWVRINGRTIGNAGSGASERSNADTQALYVYIWTTYSQPTANLICPVVGGIGASALNDFNAGKQITLLDARARTIFGLDDMGNAAKGGFTGVSFTLGNATFGGSFGGSNSTTLLTANLPAYTPSGSVASSGTINIVGAGPYTNTFGAGSQTIMTVGGPTAIGVTGNLAGAPQGGTSTPFPTVPSFLLGTLFWKL